MSVLLIKNDDDDDDEFIIMGTMVDTSDDEVCLENSSLPTSIA